MNNPDESIYRNIIFVNMQLQHSNKEIEVFRIEKFHVEYQLELYQVLRFRSIFTQNCVHFIVTYHVFLMQYPSGLKGCNVSLEPALNI